MPYPASRAARRFVGRSGENGPAILEYRFAERPAIDKHALAFPDQGAVSPFVVRSEPDKELAEKLGANLDLRDTGIWYWGVGTFLFPSSKSEIVIPAGFESKWFTLATGGR
jgi:hypothetical protein